MYAKGVTFEWLDRKIRNPVNYLSKVPLCIEAKGP